MKRYLLFDHDGVLVDTEFWYYRAGARVLADVGVNLDKDQYLHDMSQGHWARGVEPGRQGSTSRRSTGCACFAMTTTRNTCEPRRSRSTASSRRWLKHPEPYLTGLGRFGATKEETLVVEDSARGLSSAVAAGIECAIVHNAFTQGQDFSRATYRINTLTELTGLVLGAS